MARKQNLWASNQLFPMFGQMTFVIRFLISMSFAFILVGHVQAQLPAFPGAEGAGAAATGGRGGIVYHVTKLDRNYSDTGVGTLRYGLNDGNFPAGTHRTIVFDVAGTFWLGRYGAEKGHDNGWDTQSRLDVGSNVTLAGQTAPGPVYIMGGVVKDGKTNTIIRNVTIAPGYGLRGFYDPATNGTPPVGDFPDSYVYDAIDVSGQNLVIDHVTAIYGTDETISCNEAANNLTVQYCDIAQGQNYPQLDAEASTTTYTGHALGSLLQAGSNARISIVKNLYAHLKGRLPRVGTEANKLIIPGVGAINDFRNDVFYNWLSTAGTGASGQPSANNFIANFYLAGPGGDDPVGGANSNLTTRTGGTSLFNGASSSVTKAFVTGNLKDLNKDGDPNDGVAADSSSDFSATLFQATPYDVNPGVTLNATNALQNVLHYVGARWWERDYDFTLNNTNAINTVDERIIHETFTGTGRIMAWADDPYNNDPNEGVEWRRLLALRADTTSGAAPFNRPAGWDTDGDGMPDYWEIAHGLDPNVANNNGDFDNDGYTDLEEYLNEIAAWPAPGPIIFTGTNSTRYAEIFNWQVNGDPLTVPRLGTLTSSSLWQPSRYDTAIVSNGTVVVDAVGQHAGTLRLAPDAANSATLDITGGWLKVADTLEIAAAGTATVNLTGGLLRVATLETGAGNGSFNFTGGTLSADQVTFDLTNQGGTISTGSSPGEMHVMGDLTLQSGSSLWMELGTNAPAQSDRIVVDGALQLGGTLDVTNQPGFGPGTYTLMTYGGPLSGSLAIGSMPTGYTYTIRTNTPGQVQLVVQSGSAGSEPPVFGGVQTAGGNLILSGSGPTNGVYYLLASTNVAAPLNLWTPVATNLIDANGRFSITNGLDSGRPEYYYRVLLP